MKSSFKSQNQHSERLKESTRIIEKYPERVPIICEKLKNSRDNLVSKSFLQIKFNGKV